MIIRGSRKGVDIMATFQSSSIAEIDQVSADLLTMQEEYLENAPRVNWIEMG